MSETSTHKTNDDVNELRDRVKPPEKRDYAIMARHDHIRIKWDDDVAIAIDSALTDALHEMGYYHVGVNFDSGLVVYEHPEL